MAGTKPLIADEIQRYLRTGVADPHCAAWPGGFLERCSRARADLLAALLIEVQRRALGRSHHPVPDGDSIGLVRAKVEPMVRGLFPRSEQPVILATLEKSVVFLTSANIESVLHAQEFHHAAWDLANLYLASVGADLLGDEASSIVGLSQATTCYVSPEYFADGDPFADFVVHEAAHIFHNCKRRTIGLRETRSREWLLEIEFRRRETFAYSCEAYSCVEQRAQSVSERRTLADEYARLVRISDERVDPEEVADIVRAASASRNGWKVISSRCSPGPIERVSAGASCVPCRAGSQRRRR